MESWLWLCVSPWFQSREALRPLLRDDNARKPLHIIHFSLLKETTENNGCRFGFIPQYPEKFSWGTEIFFFWQFYRNGYAVFTPICTHIQSLTCTVGWRGREPTKTRKLDYNEKTRQCVRITLKSAEMCYEQQRHSFNSTVTLFQTGRWFHLETVRVKLMCLFLFRGELGVYCIVGDPVPS